MNFIFRSIKSLKERKGKTLIILAIMLTVCLVILTSFSIQSATNLASVMARQKLGADVTLSLDMDKLMKKNQEDVKDLNSGEKPKFEPIKVPVPLEYLTELKNSKYVDSYSLKSDTSANLDGLKAVGAEDESEEESGHMPPMDMKNTGDVTICGLNDFNMGEKVNSQTITLKEGRAFNEDDLGKNVILVEETFADENELKIGDKIKLDSTEDEDVSIESEIIGIFKDSSEIDEHAYRFTSMLPYNTMYVPYTLANELKGSDYKNSVDSMTFSLNDPVNVDKFITEAKNTNIDFEQFKLDAGDKAYESMMGPIDNVASFSKTTLVVIAIFGGIILSLIIMLSMKDRIHEIGILMALGEKKIKIIGQLLTEVVLVLVVAIGISTLCGKPISNVVGNKLIQNEISIQSQQESSLNPPEFDRGNMGVGKGRFMNTNKPLEDVDPINDLDINVNSTDIFKMSLCSLAISVVATIIPASFIMRLNPKNILSKHS
ncbi:ABC transporter permease [Paraclostridium sordellii]|uniref:ABC transporter permease n=1 Tax=Paraclostridium sordellii TaxID=1505 RepID=UPI0018DC2F48|nr:ABC transporter permease [Paeniclostridium sordellii]